MSLAYISACDIMPSLSVEFANEDAYVIMKDGTKVTQRLKGYKTPADLMTTDIMINVELCD